MKAGLWGSGFAAASHAAALRALGVEITAVCGRGEESVKAFARQHGIARYGADPALLLYNAS